MAYKLSFFLSCLLLATCYASAAPVIYGEEVAVCSKSSSDNSTGIQCLEKQLQQTEQTLQHTLAEALARVQSEDWLLPNMDYEDENSQVVKDAANALRSDQTAWAKHKVLFCQVASSQISSKAPNYPGLVTQCKINMNKARIAELKQLMAQLKSE